MNGKLWIIVGAILASVAVAAGAMGTHYLKEVRHLDEASLQTYDTAVRYQMTHAIGLILIGLMRGRCDCHWLSCAAIALTAGIVLFSGGLYAWLLSGVRAFVHVVPFGGGAWIVGWLLLAFGAKM